MALVNTTDAAYAKKAIADWLGRVLPEHPDVEITELTAPTGGGLSNEIYSFDASYERGDEQITRGMVARVAPTGERLFPAYDLPLEYRLLSTLGDRTTIPVPTIVGIETDKDVLGESFLVMDRVEGRVPADDPPFTVAGWVTELSADQRATMMDNALVNLAEIHRVDWQALGFDALLHPEWGEPGLEQQVGYLDNFARWVLRGRSHPTIDSTLEWVKANLPDDTGALVLNWGDARPGNIIFGDELQVSAVLDWEMASISSPDLDLGFWLFLQRHHTEGIGVPVPEGFPDHAQIAERYFELTGHRPAHLDYCEVLAALQTEIVMVRFADLLTFAGVLPEDSDMRTNNPAAHLLSKMIGIAAPAGEAAGFLGRTPPVTPHRRVAVAVAITAFALREYVAADKMAGNCKPEEHRDPLPWVKCGAHRGRVSSGTGQPCIG